MSALRIEILPDPTAVAHRAATVVEEHARTAVAERGMFRFAVSGGRTPWAMFSEFAHDEFPWEQTAIYQVDERVAPAGDTNRNLTHLLESMPPAALTRIHAMPVEASDLDAGAHRYADLLPERFDLIHLGIGPDGHTASLVPGDPVLDALGSDVALTGPYMGYRRMTITYPVLNRARALLWLVTGADKLDALRGLRDQNLSIPAGRVATDKALILADTAAAGE